MSSYGLLGLNAGLKREAKDAYGRVAELESARETANDNIEAANHTRNMSAAGTGAGIGFMAGGPVGAVVGGVGGYLISSIFG